METKKIKVLAVDDDPSILDLLKCGLEVLGYSVTTCENAVNAEGVLKKTKPDIILMDVSMPGLDGISMCRQIKLSRETAEIPIIMLTAFNDGKTFNDAMLFGASGFLTKPFDILAVKNKIEECVYKAGNKKENQK